MQNKKLKVIDLFAGIGGLTYGFYHNPRYEVIMANEILPDMARGYSLNHPNAKMYIGDIKKLSFGRVAKDLDLKIGDIDIIVGGPPCQAYSTIGKRRADDPRGKLFEEYYRVLKEFQPKLFIFENVRGLLSMNKGKLIEDIRKSFKSLGYKIKTQILNAADYGAPQIRERVIIVGSKLEKEFEYPKAVYGDKLKPYITIAEAISDLPFIESGEVGINYQSEPKTEYQKLMRKNAPIKLVDHECPKNGAKLIRIMKALPDGGTPNDIPEEMRPTSGYANTYCRLWWNKPSTTITRNLGTPSSSRCVHPKAPRPLTTREGARLQGFPDDYKFYGSRASKNLQIGNAVPTQLSIALANAVEKAF
ncbi:MAG: DNA cytosine methyltransferase [Bifidobacteriaceae bacterium]|jgi:DNA (cytosine-5)-methyltransferase 1|nr:DNA cytosine methyltransferase [Bifidobacteriaceae bacterium]